MALNLPSDVATQQRFIPVTRQTDKIAATWRVFPDHAALMAAVAIERLNIADGMGIWTNGEPLKVVTEPVGSYRIWFIDSALINPVQRAAASNAWRGVLGNLSVTMMDDTGVMRAGSGAPANALGVTGDWYADYASGGLLRKNYVGSWDTIAGGVGPRIPAALLQLDPNIPQINQTFSDFMESRGTLPHTTYSFGTNAQAIPATTSIVINSLSALDTHFDEYQAGTGATTINGQMEVMPATFNSTNTEIAADKMILRATLDAGVEWEAKWWSQSDGNLSISLTAGATQLWNRIPSNRSDLASGTYPYRVGQVWFLYGRGSYVVTEMTPGTSFKIAALPGATTAGSLVYNAVVMTPIDSGTVTAAFSNSMTTMQFAPGALHTAIQPGYRVCVSTAQEVLMQSADVVVQTINHATGVVTLNRNMPVGVSMPVGTRFLFYPRIRGAQAWTKLGWNIYGPAVFHAVEADMENWAGLSETANSRNVNGSSAYNTLNAASPDYPWGDWRAIWWYGHTMGGSTPGTNEVDLEEGWANSTEGTRQFSTGVLGPGVGAVVYNKTDMGYSVSGNGKNLIPFSMVGDHKVAVIYTGTHTYHYLDDQLIHIRAYSWQTTRHIQLGVNMSKGWASASGAANLTIPIQTSHFTRSTQSIRYIKIWNEI